MKIIHGSRVHEILLALRAGPISSSALAERFANNYGPGILSLCRAGYATNSDDIYAITPAGRAACPPRRIKSPPTIRKLEEPAMTVDKKTPITLRMLRAIEANPGINCDDLMDVAEVKATGANANVYLKTYITRGLVICSTADYIFSSNSKRRRTYHLADGKSADDCWGAVHTKKTQPPAVQKRRKEREAWHKQTVESEQPAGEPTPEDAEKSLAAADDRTQTAPQSPEPTKTTAAEPTPEIPTFLRVEEQPIKLAITSQQTVIIYGITPDPVELTTEQSQALVGFCARLEKLMATSWADRILERA